MTSLSPEAGIPFGTFGRRNEAEGGDRGPAIENWRIG